MSIDLIDAAFSNSTEEKPDWDFACQGEVDGIAQRAARKAAESYSGLEYEDACQDALVLLATRSSKAKAALGVGPGALSRWIGQRLRDQHLTEARRRSQVKSWEANQDQLEAAGH
ncbi:hypothetical protein [Streptomyces sp. NPDC092295]|uniref:hypothetical protein n=1 Tax=Streptomyces sp. NPDC092295 TaxID=3366011 RepID=UPI00381FA0BF